MVVVQILLITVAALAALFYFGWGVTHLLFPSDWNEYELLAAPFIGYSLIATLDYLALFSGFNLTTAAIALVIIVTLVNAFAFYKHRPSLPHFSRTHAPILFIALVLFLVTVAPLFRYGYITLIGENWDFEFYLPLAEYLKTYTITQLANAPANPLIQILTSRHIGPLPMGFAYLQTTVDVLFGLDTLDSFVILCGLLRALGVISAYIFYRTTFKMNDRASLIASALYAASGLLLWITFWEFGLHLASLALLPLALALGVRVLRAPPVSPLPLHGGALVPEQSAGRVGEVALAALLLAALNVTFHPTLIAALLPLGFIGLYFLITQTNRARTLQIGIALLVLAALFSFPTLFHVQDFRREYYGRTPLATGLRDFIPGSDGFGTSLYTLSLVVGQTIPTPWLFAIAKQVWDLTALPVEITMLALGFFAVIRLWRDKERRVIWYLILAANLIYVFTFRLDFLHPYPYGFLKALTLFVFILNALVAEGLTQISDFRFPSSVGTSRRWRFVPSWDFRLPSPVFRLLPYALYFILFASALFTFGISLEQYFKPAPMFFNSDALAIRNAKNVLPKGATIFLTDRTDAPRVDMGLAAYALRDFVLYGKVQTGYAQYDNVKPGAVYDFALLTRGEEARLRGYDSRSVWENSLWTLAGKPEGLLAHWNTQGSLDPLPYGSVYELFRRPTTDEATFLESARRISLGISSFTPQTITLGNSTGVFTYTLAPGLSVLNAPIYAPNSRLTDIIIAPGNESPTYTFLELWSTDEPQLATRLDTLLARASTQSLGNAFTTNLDIVNPTHANLQWQFIVRGTRAGQHQEEVFAQNSLESAPEKSARVEFDPTRGTLKMSFDSSPAKDFSFAPLGDGKYRAALEVFHDNVLHARIELYQWERQAGQLKPTLTDTNRIFIAP